MDQKKKEGKKSHTLEEAAQIMGIPVERTEELRDLMLQIAETMKQRGLPLSVPHLVAGIAEVTTDVRESAFIGIIFGQSLASMNNPMMGLLKALAASTEER